MTRRNKEEGNTTYTVEDFVDEVDPPDVTSGTDGDVFQTAVQSCPFCAHRSAQTPNTSSGVRGDSHDAKYCASVLCLQ